jgi:hypothetical protein
MKTNNILDNLLAEIPAYTQNYINMEMLIMSRIYDLLEIDGWTKEKINKNTPEIIKIWFNEKFDFTLLSIVKMEDALNAKIIKVINYE